MDSGTWLTERTGEAAAITTAVLWSFSALFFGLGTRRASAHGVNQSRLILACVFLGATVGGLAAFGRLEGGLPPGRQGAFLLASGFVGLTLGDAALFRAFAVLDTRRVVLMGSLAPVFAAFLAAPLLGERLGFVTFLGIELTLAGIAWVLVERKSAHVAEPHVAEGLTLAGFAALGQAGGAVLAKAGLGGAPADSPLGDLAGGASAVPVSPLVGTAFRMAAGAAGLLLWSVAKGRLGDVRAVASDSRTALLVVAGTVCGPFVGVWLSLVAFSRTETAVAQTLISLTPVVVLPISWALFRDRPSLRATLGALVAVVGVAVLALR